MVNRYFEIINALILFISLGTGCKNTHHEEFDTSLSQTNIFNRLGVAPVDGGFAQDDYWVWDSAVIKGYDEKCHTYASRWPKFIPFHPGWIRWMR